jgi:hypothetical protein
MKRTKQKPLIKNARISDINVGTTIFPSNLLLILSLDLSTKNPIVFCHGLLGFDSVTIGPSIAPIEVTHWRGIKEVLESNGTQVLVTRVPATSSPVDRAKVLADRISQVYPDRSVHLIGTSRSVNILEVLMVSNPG